MPFSVNPITVGGGVTLVLAIVIAAIRLNAYTRIKRALAARQAYFRQRQDSDGKVAKMDQQLDRIEAKMDRQSDTLDDLQDDFHEMEVHVNEGFRTVALLHHADPRIDNDVLRNRLGIEDLDDDLFRGSWGEEPDVDPDRHLDEWDPRNP